MDLASLSARTRLVFQQIVETYLETGDPVGSRTISRLDTVGLSPASIRNVMADLEDIGLITAPHISAGRVPTDIGLRLFVDGLMQVGALSGEEQAAIRAQCDAKARSFEETLGEASRALSGLSHCASLVMVPKSDVAIRYIEFVPLGGARALLVMVMENGSVENRLLSLPPGLPQSSLVRASNFLSARLSGKTLSEAKERILQEFAAKQSELDALAEKLVTEGLAVWSGDNPGGGHGAHASDDGSYGSLIVSGQAHLFDGARGAEDLERLRLVFEELERKKDLIRLLDMARDASGVRLFIGAENNLFSLSGSSLIVAPYMKERDKIVGVIGVIGPTRLNYARIIPMVDYTAKLVSRLL